MRLTLVLKTLRGRWKNAVGWGGALVAMTTMQLYIYPSIQKSGDAMDQFINVFPKEMIAMFRIEDYTSAVGFLGTELFSMMIPLVFLGLGASWGASAGAEEEERGTSEVIYALPISRTRVLVSKLVALWVILLAIAVVEYCVLVVGASIVDLDLTKVHLVAGLASSVGIGLFFNGLALVTASGTGSRGLALGLAIGVALLSFLVFSLAPMVDSFDAILPAMPFEWALGKSPLKDGFDWVGLGCLGLGALVCYGTALLLLNRRDLDA